MIKPPSLMICTQHLLANKARTNNKGSKKKTKENDLSFQEIFCEQEIRHLLYFTRLFDKFRYNLVDY